MKNILFLGAGPAMPFISKAYVQKYEVLSKHFKGYIITPASGKPSLKVKKIGTFAFEAYPYYMGNTLLRNFHIIIMSLYKTFKLRITHNIKIDVIITHAPLTIGLIAIFLGKIFKASTIIEVNGNFAEAFKYDRLGNIQVSFFNRIQEQIALYIAKFCISHCSLVKLLYADQLTQLKLRKKPKTYWFPDFVPVSHFIAHEKKDDKFVLLLGFPWNLKGVDILIKAFKRLSNEFPDYSLKIFGWNPKGTKFFEDLAQGTKNIYLGQALEYDQVIEIMTACSLYVQASRTEGIARVLIEAMACEKPIIASNVGGTSSIIKDGFNGLLFQNENFIELSDKIKLVLSNIELKNSLAKNGFDYVQKYLLEEKYFNKYCAMVDMALI